MALKTHNKVILYITFAGMLNYCTRMNQFTADEQINKSMKEENLYKEEYNFRKTHWIGLNLVNPYYILAKL